MRDRYLFRAKRIDNGEWVEGYLFDDGFENGRMFVGGLVIEEYYGTACDDWSITGINFYEVDPSTICQCTGLKDKNGKLIWENDVVSLCDDIYKIVWDEDDARFALEDESVIESFNNIEGKWCEVAGNIFDNPELMYE